MMTTQKDPELIEALMSPERYPHPVQGVERKQTHMSWVLLAGEFAYKIKKPVKFAFVDFSTLDQRHQDCREELRLNQRFAPQLYLDVVPIGGSAQVPVVNGGGSPIEYAVRLRRFAADDELRALITGGTVTAQELERFGRRLSQIHNCSPVCAGAEASEQALRTALANLQELVGLGTSGSHGNHVLLSWTRQEWKRISAIVGRRCATDRVRECHGDLHIGNVVRFNGELTAFDCIAFNFELRCIDVFNDVAFLTMDLIAHGHQQLAYAFLNGWLEESGDYGGVPLLRFFAVYRALVRVKVALLGGDERSARDYGSLAEQLTRDRRPMLLITCGLSGSGKTWFSQRVMTEVGAIRIRSDVERKRMAGLRSWESSRSRPDVHLYSLEFNDRVYAQLLDQARTSLQAGETAIVDAAFLKRSERVKFLTLARQLGVSFRIVYCVARPDELQQRLQDRQRIGRDASEADVATMHRQIGAWEPFAGEEEPAVIEVETASATAVALALSTLRSGIEPLAGMPA